MSGAPKQPRSQWNDRTLQRVSVLRVTTANRPAASAVTYYVPFKETITTLPVGRGESGGWGLMWLSALSAGCFPFVSSSPSTESSTRFTLSFRAEAFIYLKERCQRCGSGETRLKILFSWCAVSQRSHPAFCSQPSHVVNFCQSIKTKLNINKSTQEKLLTSISLKFRAALTVMDLGLILYIWMYKWRLRN